MNIKKEGYTKQIYYSFPGTDVEEFQIMIEYEENKMDKKLIKWSINKPGEFLPLYFMIDSLKPLRVLGGIAAWSEHIFHYIWESEEEIVKFVEDLTYEKLIELMKQSICISYKDKDQMMVPPGGEIKLYVPSPEEIEFKKKVMEIFANIK